MIAGHLVAVWRRPARIRWGATDDEAVGELPGDALVAEPSWTTTRAISIHAPCEQVWPWVAQIGQERGGFYSFERLENLIGCRVRNAERIVDDWQHPTVGEEVHLHTAAPPLQVAVLEPGRTFVLRGAAADSGDPQTASVWGFHLRPSGPTGCRLIERNRTRHGRSLLQRLTFGPALVEPIGFVMSREMLRSIKERVERAAHR